MKKTIALLLVLMLVVFCSGCMDAPVNVPEETEESEDYLDDESLYFGRGEVITPSDSTSVLIEYAEPIDCTKENLAKWFKQDVKDKEYNYALIIYDGGDNMGVYASPEGVIHTDVVIEDDSFVDTTSQSKVYTYKNGKLEE